MFVKLKDIIALEPQFIQQTNIVIDDFHILSLKVWEPVDVAQVTKSDSMEAVTVECSTTPSNNVECGPDRGIITITLNQELGNTSLENI